MKNAFKLFIISFFLIPTLLSFQNCGKKEQITYYPDDPAILGDGGGEEALPLVADGSEVVKATEGNDVNLVVSDKVLKLIDGSKAICKWGYFSGDSADELKLSEVKTTYRLDKIELSEKGKYRTFCSDGKKMVLYIFLVEVAKKAPPVVKAELLVVKIKNRVTSTYLRTANLTQAAATSACADAIKKISVDPDAGYRCTWNSKVSKSRAETGKAYVEYKLIQGSVRVQFGTLTEPEALAQCKSHVSKVTGDRLFFTCSWSGYKIDSGLITGSYVVNRIVNGSKIVYNKATLDYASAVRQCDVDAAKILAAAQTSGYQCVWKDIVIRQGVEKGYLIIAFKDMNGQLTASSYGTVTETEGRAQCAALAERAAGRSSTEYSCSVGGKKVFVGVFQRASVFSWRTLFGFTNSIHAQRTTFEAARTACAVYKSTRASGFGSSYSCSWNGIQYDAGGSGGN